MGVHPTALRIVCNNFGVSTPSSTLPRRRVELPWSGKVETEFGRLGVCHPASHPAQQCGNSKGTALVAATGSGHACTFE